MTGGALQQLGAIYEGRHASLRAWRQRSGTPIVGCIGSDIPVELIHAAGMLPVRLAGNPGAATEIADRLAGTAADPAARSIVTQLLDGTIDYIDHLVIASTPAVLASVYNFFVEARRIDPDFAGPEPYLHDVVHGVTEASEAFDRQSLDLFRARLESWRGSPIAPDDLRRGIEQANVLRTSLARLGEHRVARRIRGEDALRAFGAAFAAPADEVIALLGQLASELDDAPALDGVPVIVSGSDVDAPRAYAEIEAAGALIVADDHDWGTRGGEGPVGASGDDMVAIATRYRSGPPAAAGRRITERQAYLRALAERSGARAVVFRILAVDHPSAWDYPRLRDYLNAHGVPTIELGSLRYRDPLPAEAADRLATFLREQRA